MSLSGNALLSGALALWCAWGELSMNNERGAVLFAALGCTMLVAWVRKTEETDA